MGRVNLKSIKRKEKHLTRIVKIAYLSDYYELRLVSNSNLVDCGSLDKVLKVRQNFESNYVSPVQLELF